jgi:hypothetical protein
VHRIGGLFNIDYMVRNPFQGIETDNYLETGSENSGGGLICNISFLKVLLNPAKLKWSNQLWLAL